MVILLPLLAAIFLFGLRQIKESCWRDAVLQTAIIWGVVAVVITEGLSLIHGLTGLGVSLSWVGVNLGLGWLVWQQRWRSPIPKGAAWNLSPGQSIVLAGVLSIVAIVGLISLVAPPNNWDSMAYVMPRVVHWMQNRSVEHYPTHYLPQLHNGPWAEFATLQLQILSGGDLFANVVHWLSLAGSLVGVSLIAKQLGGNLQAQIFAVVFCATIPVGILHASTPKNTYIVAFWLVCFVFYGLVSLKTKLTWKLTFLLSSSLGLAILTKGTAYIYALSYVLILLALHFYRLRFSLIKYLIASSVVILGLNIGHWHRNFLIFNSINSTAPFKLTNDIYSFPVFISNLIRNISLHLIPPFSSDSYLINQFVIWSHYLIGISPVDSRTTFPDNLPMQPKEFTLSVSPLFEDVAGNPLHFWLIIIAVITLMGCARLRRNQYLVGYLAATLWAFFLFCFLLKWQPWHSRLHLPIFVLLAPVVGIALTTIWHQKITQYALLILLLSAVPYLLFNDLRPLVGETSILVSDRTSQYFAARQTLEADYRQVTQLVKQQACTNVGLFMVPDAWEYPLWVLLENKQQPVRIEHVAVENMTKAIAQRPEYQSFMPCSVIGIGQTTNQITIQNRVYQSRWRSTGSHGWVQWYQPN